MNNCLYIMNADILSDEELFRFYYEKTSEFRKKKIDAFRFENDKRLSLSAGILLHNALIREGLSDNDICLGKNNKPFIRGRGDIYFNISHSGTLAVCAVSDRSVGVDIEQEQHFDEGLQRRIYLPEEIEYVLRNYKLPDRRFTELWTIKESIMKYYGVGMFLEPDSILITYDNEIRAAVNGADASGLHFTQYHVQGYALTVCSEYKNFTDGVRWFYPTEHNGMQN